MVNSSLMEQVLHGKPLDPEVVYDYLYKSPAEAEQCRVATADHRLLKTFPAQPISLAAPLEG